jgi:hypothetical protein
VHFYRPDVTVVGMVTIALYLVAAWVILVAAMIGLMLVAGLLSLGWRFPL